MKNGNIRFMINNAFDLSKAPYVDRSMQRTRCMPMFGMFLWLRTHVRPTEPISFTNDRPGFYFHAETKRRGIDILRSVFSDIRLLSMRRPPLDRCLSFKERSLKIG
jgi:hypothetical protein